MPLTSRANTHPTASRLNDVGGGGTLLPAFLRKTTAPDSPSKKISLPPPRSPPRRDKRHAFFAKKQPVTRRLNKTDEKPLLSDQDEEEALTMSRSFGSVRSFGSAKRVMDLLPVPEATRQGDAKPERVMPSYIGSPPKLRTRNSDRSYATAITASSSGSTSSGDQDHSLMTVSPPGSPNASRSILSSSGFSPLPYVREDDVKVFEMDSLSAIMRQYESDDLGSLNESTDFKPPTDEDEKSTSSSSTTSSFLANPTDAFIKLVEDCEARWNSYTESLKDWRLMPILARASDDDTASTGKVPEKEVEPDREDSFLSLMDSPAWTSSEENRTTMGDLQIVTVPQEKEEVELVVSKEAEIIRAQQEEIEYLRAQLLRQQELLIREEAAFANKFRPNELEQIDTIPMEEIEVTIDINDELSIESALTNLNDSSTRFNDDATAMLARIPPTRPDAASVIDTDAIVPTRRVKNRLVKLRAANGYVRTAKYTGPSVGGVLTGVASLRFETGDEYMGEVVDGKMHGHGTYTFAKNKEGRAKVLRGLFESNVYMGWNPDAMRRAEI